MQDKVKIKWQHYLIAILFIIVGVLFILFKEIDMTLVCRIFAGVFAVAGIISLLSYCVRDVEKGYWRLDLVVGLMALFAALLFITGKEAVTGHFPVIVGTILLANGVIKLQHSIDMKRIDRKMKKVTEMWLVVMIFALFGIAAGFVTVYLTPENERTMFIVVGSAMIVAGVSDVFTHIVFGRKVKAFKNENTETPEEEPGKTEDVKQEETEADAPEQTPEGDSDDEQVIFEVETPKTSEENTDDTDQKA